MREKIFFGYEVGSGDAVSISPSHLIVTGLTNISGKTTALEALISRTQFKAIVFKTKIGETGFSVGREIPPHYRERSDWQFVSALLEATLREKVKFERSWIIRVAKNTASLEEVDKNVVSLLERSREGSLQHSVLTNLHAYFEIILPQLKDAHFSKELTIHDGINIMDLEQFSDEVQALVIRSVLDYVLRNERNTIVVIPEAWKFIPEIRGSPVKYSAESFIRQGAVRGNFLWLDSQDLANVSKLILKQVSNYVLGIQLERNEVQHTLDQIPLPSSLKPSPDKIMTLQTGHFIVCNPQFTKTAYLMPSWLNEEVAKKVALGELGVEQVMDRKKVKIAKISYTQDALISSLRGESKKLAKRASEIERERDRFAEKLRKNELEMDRLRKRKAVPIEKYQELKGVEKKYNNLVRRIKQLEPIAQILQALSKFEEVQVSEEIEMPALPPKAPVRPIEPSLGISFPSMLGLPPEKAEMVANLPSYERKVYDYAARHKGIPFTRTQLAMGANVSQKSSKFIMSVNMLKKLGLFAEDANGIRAV